LAIANISVAKGMPWLDRFYDFQNIVVAVDMVGEYSFVWVVPDVAGTYVVEVGLVPPQLTAYAVWLEVGEGWCGMG
jgi:hypothetical protein